MLNKKILSLFICLICFTSFITAEEIEPGSLKEPNDKRVVLVGKVSVKNPIDIEARREAFQTQKALQIGQFKNKIAYYIGENILSENAAEFGETLFTIVKNKDGKL